MAETQIFDDVTSQTSVVNDVNDRLNQLDGSETVAVPRCDPLPAHFAPRNGNITYNGTGPSLEFFNQLSHHSAVYSVPERYKVQITDLYLTGVEKEFYRRWKASIRTFPLTFEQFRAEFQDVFASALENVRLYQLWNRACTGVEILQTLCDQLLPPVQDFPELCNLRSIQMCLSLLRVYDDRHSS